MKASVFIKIAIATTLFVGLGAWVQVQYGWRSTLSFWANVPPPIIVLGALLVFASHIVRVVRIYYAYRQTTPVPFLRVMGVSLVHNTVSFLLPMRLGELALPALSKHQLHIPVTYATATLILVRLFDLHILLLLLCFFAGGLWLPGANAFWIPAAILIALPLFMRLLQWAATARKKLNFILPLVSQPLKWLTLYVLSVVIWGIKLFALAILVALLGQIPINHAWLATIIADGSALSPVTGFANAGTFEAAFTLPLIPLGYNTDTLVQIAVNIHIFIFIINIVAGIFGFVFLRKHPAASPTSGT